MKIFLVFLCFSFSSTEFVNKNDIDLTNIKSVWESSQLQPALAYIKSTYKKKSKTRQSTRIIDGTKAKPGQFPFHALLKNDNTFWCGGSLITPDWVLTVKT
jgi:hypothetical protein